MAIDAQRHTILENVLFVLFKELLNDSYKFVMFNYVGRLQVGCNPERAGDNTRLFPNLTLKLQLSQSIMQIHLNIKTVLHQNVIRLLEFANVVFCKKRRQYLRGFRQLWNGFSRHNHIGVLPISSVCHRFAH